MRPLRSAHTVPPALRFSANGLTHDRPDTFIATTVARSHLGYQARAAVGGSAAAQRTNSTSKRFMVFGSKVLTVRRVK